MFITIIYKKREDQKPQPQVSLFYFLYIYRLIGLQENVQIILES